MKISQFKIGQLKIGIASDHAGFNLKSAILKNFQNKINWQFLDYGCKSAETSVDYPEVARELCQKYIKGEFDFGVLICGSGIGISIAANRFKEIRAALCHNQETAVLAREHNNANILCLGARMINESAALQMVEAFLTAEFAGGRHQARVEKL